MSQDGYKYGFVETVRELRTLLSDLDDATPIRFEDPDTDWRMRFVKRIRIEEDGFAVVLTAAYSDV